MTGWGSSDHVYGARLECAYLTTACAPLGYPVSLLEGASPDILNSDGIVATTAVMHIIAAFRTVYTPQCS